MVDNCFLRCQVCHHITRVRLQVGFLEEHPIVVTCGECGISLSGRVKIGPENPGLEYEFENADIVGQEKQPDYITECSGEFPVQKPYKSETALEINLSPFIANQIQMGSDGYEKFRKDVNILNSIYHRWSDYKRVIDLQKNGKREYLLPEIWKIIPKEYFPCRDEYEILRAIHLIEIRYFLTPLKKDFLDDLSFSSDILNLFANREGSLLEFFAEHDGYSLEEMQASIYKVYEEFVKAYPALIPALATRYYATDDIDYESVGSTTSTFDTVKQFYLDTYETLGNLLIIPVALNNMKYRHDFSECYEVDGKSCSLEEFLEKPKARKFHYCLENEIYTKTMGIQFNSKLRNAIGHNDVNYDNLTQKLTYIPDSKNRAKKKTTYLLQFEDEALRLFQSILVVSEYLYRLREVDLMEKGVDFLLPEELNRIFRKVGRNEPCPCGSGLKYKRCHGKSY